MRTRDLLGCFFPLLALAALPATAPPRLTTTPLPYLAQEERHALVRALVERWGPHARAAHGESVQAWARRLGPRFRDADLAALRAARRAPDLAAMTAALMAPTPVDYVAHAAPAPCASSDWLVDVPPCAAPAVREEAW